MAHVLITLIVLGWAAGVAAVREDFMALTFDIEQACKPLKGDYLEHDGVALDKTGKVTTADEFFRRQIPPFGKHEKETVLWYLDISKEDSKKMDGYYWLHTIQRHMELAPWATSRDESILDFFEPYHGCYYHYHSGLISYSETLHRVYIHTAMEDARPRAHFEIWQLKIGYKFQIMNQITTMFRRLRNAGFRYYQIHPKDLLFSSTFGVKLPLYKLGTFMNTRMRTGGERTFFRPNLNLHVNGKLGLTPHKDRFTNVLTLESADYADLHNLGMLLLHLFSVDPKEYFKTLDPSCLRVEPQNCLEDLIGKINLDSVDDADVPFFRGYFDHIFRLIFSPKTTSVGQVENDLGFGTYVTKSIETKYQCSQKTALKFNRARKDQVDQEQEDTVPQIESFTFEAQPWSSQALVDTYNELSRLHERMAMATTLNQQLESNPSLAPLVFRYSKCHILAETIYLEYEGIAEVFDPYSSQLDNTYTIQATNLRLNFLEKAVKIIQKFQEAGLTMIDFRRDDFGARQDGSLAVTSQAAGRVMNFNNVPGFAKKELCKLYREGLIQHFVPELDTFCLDRTNFQLNLGFDSWKAGVLAADVLSPGMMRGRNIRESIADLKRQIKINYQETGAADILVKIFEGAFQIVPKNRISLPGILQMIAKARQTMETKKTEKKAPMKPDPKTQLKAPLTSQSINTASRKSSN